MRTRAFSLVAALIFGGLTISAQKDQIYSGEIIDGLCVSMRSLLAVPGKSRADSRSAASAHLFLWRVRWLI